ncbi:hypothetical protein BASA81_003684 [Batrachochytrium salamandrivorans]|nr:hypothetical protein BASA81_003684 [Batrachochytrium salamandrivorans]
MNSTQTANLLAGAASVASIAMWLAPIQAIWLAKDSIYHTQSSSKVSTAFGFVAGAVQCTLWVMYASTRLEDMTIPLLVNLFGGLLNLSFVMCYWIYSVGDQRTKVFWHVTGLCPALVLGVGVWYFDSENVLVGYIAVVLNVLMYFGPLAAAGEVVKKRNNQGMILPQLALTVLCGLLWFVYGWYIADIPVMIPNAIGTVFGVLQLALYFWAKRAHERDLHCELHQVSIESGGGGGEGGDRGIGE